MVMGGVRGLTVAVGVAAALLAGCTGGSADRDPPAGEEATLTPDRSPDRSPDRTPDPGTRSGAGLAINRSDVGGLPDTPLDSGAVLFVAEARVAELAVAASLDLADPSGLPHASFVIDTGSAADLIAAVAVIDTGGRFPVEVPSGRYLVCLADILAEHRAGPPHSVVGCAYADLPGGSTPERQSGAPSGGGAFRLIVAFGEGGVEVTRE